VILKEVKTGRVFCLSHPLDRPGGNVLNPRCAVLDGYDKRLLEWIADSGLAAIAADNLAVERSSTLGIDPRAPHRGPQLPLHEHCLVKLGIHLGELWYLTELAEWLRGEHRSSFLLTAPPLRMPGAAGSPVTPVATV
jgi:kynurenine formamidase